MRKEKKGTRRLTRQSALDYWNHWAIARKDKEGTYHTLLIIGPSYSMREADTKTHRERILKRDFNYICELIEESPYNLTSDELLQREFILNLVELGYTAPFDNEARAKIDRICRALKGRSQGKENPDKLRSMIKRDTHFYKSFKKEQSKGKESDDAIITLLIIDYGFVRERARQIIKAYDAIIKECLPHVETIDSCFHFLDVCRENVDKAFHVERFKGVAFIKGDIVANATMKAF